MAAPRVGDPAHTLVNGRRVQPLDTEPLTDPDSFAARKAEAAERVNAWADRLRAKRERTQAAIRADQTAAADPDEPAGPAHWNEDTVLGRDRSGERFDVLSPVTAERTACLGVLGLDAAATDDDVAVAYRRLAKEHHPDRWAEADPSVQTEHAEAMLRVNAAYRTLRAQTLS
jgi:hypothetical protein